MYMFLVHFFVTKPVILGFYLGERLFELRRKEKEKGTRIYISTCFGTLDRKNDISTNVFLYFTVSRADDTFTLHFLAPAGMQNKYTPEK